MGMTHYVLQELEDAIERENAREIHINEVRQLAQIEYLVSEELLSDEKALASMMGG
jgi:hypothetical protein